LQIISQVSSGARRVAYLSADGVSPTTSAAFRSLNLSADYPAIRIDVDQAHAAHHLFSKVVDEAAIAPATSWYGLDMAIESGLLERLSVTVQTSAQFGTFSGTLLVHKVPARR